MKKKQRCLLKRFAALVAALMLCASLCVPAFASNNASTRKWVVAEEAQMPTESGSVGKYFKLSPYVNGEMYAAPITTTWAKTFFTNVSGSSSSPETGSTALFACPLNYPDWWRSAIPLGGLSYVTIDNVTLIRSSNGSLSFPTHVNFYFYSSQYSFVLTQSNTVGVSPAYDLTSPLMAYPISARSPRTNSAGADIYEDTSAASVQRSLSSSGPDSLHPLQQCTQLVYSSIGSSYDSIYGIGTPGMGLKRVNTLYNLSSDDLVIMALPFWSSLAYPSHESPNFPSDGSITVTAVISFWVDANKLPAGLQVGDEFPADTDAFDQLRDDLIDQFPEASENIQTGKDTIQGWNDTETVDIDVASTSISALNALFQNLGGFLFIISLMVFGAVVLRMLIRKAVDG